MAIIFHVLSKNNPFERDRFSEKEANTLAQSLSNNTNFNDNCEILNWNLSDDAQKDRLKNTLLSQNADIFHVIILAGQGVQESLYLMLKNISLENTFIIYNSNWDMLGAEKITFGNMVDSFHYNLGENFRYLKIDYKARSSGEAAMAVGLLTTELFTELSNKYTSKHPALSNNRTNNRYNFYEKESQSDNRHDDLWGHALQQLPEKIISAFGITNDLLNNSENQVKCI